MTKRDADMLKDAETRLRSDRDYKLFLAVLNGYIAGKQQEAIATLLGPESDRARIKAELNLATRIRQGWASMAGSPPILTEEEATDEV